MYSSHWLYMYIHPIQPNNMYIQSINKNRH